MISMMLAAMTLTGTAQEIKTFEYELKVGATYPTQKFIGSKRLGPQLGMEARWNLKRLPMDVGAELYVGSAVRESPEGWDMSNRTAALSAVVDYNFNRGRAVSPFVGAGISLLSQYDVIEGSYGDERGKMLGCVTPRVGVELWRHLRITIEHRFCIDGYSTVGLSIGYVFGGGFR